jgi:hypothetical protein
VRRQGEVTHEKERSYREGLEQELAKFRTYCTSLEAEIDYLHKLLKKVSYISSSSSSNNVLRQCSTIIDIFLSLQSAKKKKHTPKNPT